jgi:hypothetical protein
LIGDHAEVIGVEGQQSDLKVSTAGAVVWEYGGTLWPSISAYSMSSGRQSLTTRRGARVAIELPRVKPGKSDASYLVKPIEADDIDRIVGATQRLIGQGHLKA